MLEVKDLHKFYGSFHAVKGINFQVNKGEIVGFLGPNGAGKTTTMKIIVGYMSMSAGEVRVNGYSVTQDSLKVRESIGYLPEHAPLYEDMTVVEYLRFIAAMRELKGSRRKERIDYVIGVCSLAPKRRALIKTLSKGYRQRVGLAQAIIHDPKLVILDEPTAGLDPNQIIGIRELLRAIAERNTVILSSHILSEVEATCGRVMISADGRIVAEGTPRDLEEAHSDDLLWHLRLKGATADLSAELGGIPGLSDLRREEDADDAIFAFRASKGREFAPELDAFLRDRKLVVEELSAQRPTLEDVFKSLTAGQAGVGQATKSRGDEAAEVEPVALALESEKTESGTKEPEA